MPRDAGRGQPQASGGRLLKLESLRGLAASYVVCSHFWPERGPLLFRFGQEAVILFFLLSGFVIHHSTCSKAAEPFTAYLLRRARRVYPLFVIALVSSYIVYAVECTYARERIELLIGTLVGNLAMLQDLPWVKRGTWVEPFHDPPLWSLSYEWWFYMIFFPLWYGVASHAHRRVIVATLGIGAVVVGQWIPNPATNFLAYFPLWWAGVELSTEWNRTGSLTWRGQAWSLAIIVGLIGAWSVVALLGRRAEMSYGMEPLLQLRHAAAGLILLVVGLLWTKVGFVGFDQTLGPFKWIAPFSYALYVLHAPILLRAATHFDGWARVVATAVSLAGVVVLAYLLEVRLQAWINQKTNPWLRRLVAGRVEKKQNRADVNHAGAEITVAYTKI